jgi:hypothetical protein
MGWKDTVRMNPLEDIVVALQPITPQLPWPIPNSVRLNDVTGSNMFSNLDPFSNNGATTVDGPTNFGWEYVWHCHILGHEENDMMRPIMWQVPPNTPGPLAAAANANGSVDISFTDNSASETGFTVQRDIDPAFPNPTNIQVAASPTRNVIGEGTDYGSAISVNDPPQLNSGTTYYYRVQAVDDGFNLPHEQLYNTTSALLSGWSNIATISTVPIIGVAPVSLAFGTVAVGSGSTSAPVVISNTGTATLTITSMTSSAPDFVPTLCSSVPAGQTCAFTVTFSPSAGGPQNASLTIASNDPARPSVTVSMTGTGVVGTNMTITAPTITYGANGAINVSVAATSGTASGNVSLTVDGGAPLTLGLTAGSATFNLTAPAAGSHALVANYAAQNGFQASTANGTLVVNGAPLTVTASSGSMIYGGPVPAITPGFSPFVLGQTAATALTTQPTCSTTATSATPVASYPSNCSGAVAPNYAITYVAGTVTLAKDSSTTTIVSNLPNPSIIGQIVTIKYTVNPQFAGSVVTGTVTVKASTGESCTAAPTAGACTITFQTGGSRTIVATYSGDGNITGSASTAVTQNVSNVSLSTTSLLFGNQVVGTRSAQQQVTIANVGTTTLTITGFAWSPNFSDSNNCGGSLAPGRSCRVNVAFVPTTTGVLTGTLTITDSDITSPQIVTLTGTGVQAGVSLSPTSHSFGTQARRTTSAPFTFTLSNTGTASLTINSIGLGGANPNQFAIQSRTCTNTLAAGSSCSINVVFSPNNRATYNATLQVNDNAPNSPQTGTLTGTGQ